MDIPQYLQRARTALQEGEYEMATRYFQQILNKYPQNPDALQGMKAIQVAQARKRLSPFSREMKLLWAQLCLVLKRAESVYAGMELLYHCLPEHIRTAMIFAQCAEKTGHFNEAHEAYSRALHLDSTLQAALSNDAEILVKMDRLEEAAQRYQRLLSLRPHDDKVSHRLRDISAQSFARVGIPENLKERRAKIEKEKREAPAPPEVMQQLEELLHAYKQRPENKEIGVQIAIRYREAGLYEEANRILATILDKTPDHEPARREQARVWRQSGEFAIAQSLYQELLKAHPTDRSLRDEYLNTTVEFLARQIQTGEISQDRVHQVEQLKIERDQNRIELLQDDLKNHPEAFETRIELGELLLRGGQPDEAIPIVQRVIHEPSYAGKGLFLLGQCFRAKGDIKLAVRQFEQSLEFYKNKGYSHVLTDELKLVYYTLGLAKQELGDPQGARDAFGTVYSADINYKDIRQRYETLF